MPTAPTVPTAPDLDATENRIGALMVEYINLGGDPKAIAAVLHDLGDEARSYSRRQPKAPAR